MHIGLSFYMAGAERTFQGEQYSRKGKEKKTPTTMRDDEEPSTSGKRAGGPVESTLRVAPATSSTVQLQGQQTPSDDWTSVEGELSPPNPSGNYKQLD